jgi:SAM-dependent methyltransferase
MPNKFRPHYFPPEGQLRAARKGYVDYLPVQGNIVDLGCGRGEFLELLSESGRQGVGVESDPALVAVCRSKGLKVDNCGVLEWLRTNNDCWDGIMIGHLIEHLSGSEAYELIQLATQRLTTGGRIVLLTPNPNFLPGMGEFWSDLTHIRPYPRRSLHGLFEELGLHIVTSGIDPSTRLGMNWRHPYQSLVNAVRLLLLRLIMLEDYDGGEIFVVGEVT